MLTDRQRDIAIARLPPNAPSHANLHFNKAEIIDAVKTVQIWIFCLAFFSLITVLYSQQYFIPRIIASLGFKSYDAQLLSVGLQMTGALYK